MKNQMAQMMKVANSYAGLRKEMALNNKKTEVMNKWISSNIKSTYIKFSDETKHCNLSNKWIKD